MIRHQFRRGQVLVLFAVILPILLGFVALAVDIVYAFAVKAALVTAVDASALAGARAIVNGPTAVATAVATTFNADLPAGHLVRGAPSYTPNPPVIVTESDGTRSIALTGTAKSPTFFLNLFGYNGLNVGAYAKAGRRDMNIMLVLDRSTSLDQAHAWGAVQSGASFFVQQFDDTHDKVGLVSFGTNARVERSPQTPFKAPLLTTISNMRIINTTYTNSALGIFLAYDALRTLNEPLKSNVIVYFTDGLTTASPGQFPVYTASTHNPSCKTSPQDGVLVASGGTPPVTGIWRLAPTSSLGTWTSPEATVISGCGLQSNGSNVTSLLSGNFSSTWTPTTVNAPIHISVSGINPVSLSSRSEQNISNMGENLLVNVAETARQDPLAIRILVIGLGNDINADVLRRVANVSPAVSSEPIGLYVAAPDQSELLDAFRAVASSIAHLIQ